MLFLRYGQVGKWEKLIRLAWNLNGSMPSTDSCAMVQHSQHTDARYTSPFAVLHDALTLRSVVRGEAVL